jgi:hypothetical protein
MKKVLAVFSLLVVMAVLLATTQSFAASAAPETKATQAPPTVKTNGNTLKGTVSPGQGQLKQVGKKYHFRGIIAAASATSVTLTLQDGSAMTFTFGPKVQIKVPTLPKAATWENLTIGLQATVQAEKTDTGYVARMVIVVPGKPSTGHHVGTVTEYTAGTSITIVDKKGVSTTFKVTAETKIVLVEPNLVLKVGSRVTVVAPRDPKVLVQTARSIVVHLDTVNALKATPTVTK